MQKFFFTFCFFILTGILSFGQSQPENLKRLMREREQIIKEYEYYNAQNSNFWGKKSKKDLLHIIEALKAIINKDSEIINEVNLLNLNNIKKQAEIVVEKKKIENAVVDDKRVVNDNFYELKNQIRTLESQQKSKQRQVNEMQERVMEAQEKNLELQKMLALGVVVLLVLVIYVFYLRGKIPVKKSRKS